MSDLTYINKDLIMEGTLQAKESQVVIAGKYKGSIEAKTVILESTSVFDGTLNAEHLNIPSSSERRKMMKIQSINY